MRTLRPLAIIVVALLGAVSVLLAFWLVSDSSSAWQRQQAKRQWLAEITRDNPSPEVEVPTPPASEPGSGSYVAFFFPSWTFPVPSRTPRTQWHGWPKLPYQGWGYSAGTPLRFALAGVRSRVRTGLGPFVQQDPTVTVRTKSDEFDEPFLHRGDRLRARLTDTWTGLDHEIVFEVFEADGTVVASVKHVEVSQITPHVWAWNTEWAREESTPQDAFRDLNADGTDDFALLIDWYKVPAVRVWMSTPNGGFNELDPFFVGPALSGPIAREHMRMNRFYAGSWTVRATDLRRPDQPVYHRWYVVSPDSTGPGGLAPVHRYDQADSVRAAISGKRPFPEPDAILNASQVPLLDRPFNEESERFDGWVIGERRAMNERLALASESYTWVLHRPPAWAEMRPAVSTDPKPRLLTPRERAWVHHAFTQ